MMFGGLGARFGGMGTLGTGGGVPVPEAVHLPTVSAAPSAAYGMRRLISGYSGALLQAQRASDNATMDVPQISDGRPDAAAVASWAAGSETRIKAIYDQTGNARHATISDFANMPLFDAAGALGVYGTYGAFKAAMFDGFNASGFPRITKKFDVPTSVAFNRNNVSMFIVAEPRSALQNNGYLANGSFFTMSSAQSIAGVYFGGGSNAVGRRVRQQLQTIGVSSGASACKVFQDGQIVSATAKSSAALTGFTWGDAGAGTGDFLSNNDNWFGLVVYPAALSDADAQAVVAALDGNFGVIAPSGAQIVGVGDSILYAGTVNADSLKCQQTWRKVRTLLPGNPAFYNMGVGSYTLASAATNAASREFALAADGSYPKRVLFIQVGTNDLGANGGTPGYGATLYSNLTTYIGNARAAGFTKIVVCTLLPRSNGANWQAGTQYQTERDSYNTLVRANAAGADVICDRAAHPIMGVFANTSNTTYYQDNLHPTAVGYDLLAAGDGAALNAALAA